MTVSKLNQYIFYVDMYIALKLFLEKYNASTCRNLENKKK